MKLITKIKNSLAIQLLVVLTFCSSVNAQTDKFVVTLDAGHGAHDFGATYHGHVEKNIALKVALKVGQILEKNPNIKVIYTRKTDVFIDLVERANIANRADANIFVSIHCNANKNTVPDGTETYVMGLTKNASNLEAAKKENSVITLEKDYQQKYEGFNPNAPESLMGMTLMQEEFLENSIALAGKIQDNFKDYMGLKSRGVKQAPFMVLHKAYMPRVLIEMGFISNREEGARLDSEQGQDDVALGIAEAIVSYKREFFGEEPNEPKIEKPVRRIVEKPVEVIQTETVVENKEMPKADENGIIFKVQLSASSKNLELVPSNFKGLQNVTSLFENGLYKYMYGSTSSHETAKSLLQEAKSKGFSSAYLIAFKDGKSINIQDAIK
ncbi:N-acetylmuramoyl-L-alanine amidase [Flavobacterium sp.]|uniref:N-acetylmuramoyl-L-alanine amidase family protein n=1 Tax=Flavobacterium sp. TaxID=239 RepID=UPI0025C5D670|nr:N-acetylmuramoyl-L-alanine amidase [Flavobacterium sp.]